MITRELQVTGDYVEGWNKARKLMLREYRRCFGSFATPRAQTQLNTVIPLPGEPGYAEYEKDRKACNAAFEAKPKERTAVSE